jgi:hypothetical protein
MKKSYGVTVSGFGMRVLKKMSMGKILSKSSEQDYNVGSLKVPPSLINEFKRIDLILLNPSDQASPNKRGYLLSSVGEKFLKRKLVTNMKRNENKARENTRAEGDNVFSRQHKSMVRVLGPKNQKGSAQKIIVNRFESPLGWLAGHKDKGGKSFLEKRHVLAADRLRADFDMAGLNPRVTASFEGVPLSKNHKNGPSDLLPLEHQIVARRRYQQAVNAIGPGLGDVLVRACCYLEGLTDTERALGWPNRSAKLVLRLALDRLIDHYEGAKKHSKI